MSPDDQRIKNFLLFKLWMTDDEVQESSPFLLVLGIIAIVLIIWFSACHGKDSHRKHQQTSEVRDR